MTPPAARSALRSIVVDAHRLDKLHEIGMYDEPWYNAMREFNRAANPATILALLDLVDALEKVAEAAKAREHDGTCTTWENGICACGQEAINESLKALEHGAEK